MASVETLTPASVEPYYSRGLRERYRADALQNLSFTEQSTKYADITYEVDHAKYLARSASRLTSEQLTQELPAGFPEKLDGPLVWSTKDLESKEHEYVYMMTSEDKAEVLQALEHFNKQGLNGDEVNRDNFPLGKLAETLRSVAEKIYDGHGFMIIRGLDPDTFSHEDYTVVYLGITSHIAERRGKQDQRGSMLMHVMKRDYVEEPNRDDVDKPFHTDTVCDVLCLVTRSCSAYGGKSVLASAWTVYNELAATRPDLIQVLAKPDWPFDTYGRSPPYYKRALLYFQDGRMILNYSRRLLVGHPPREKRTEGIPGLTEAQAEALDALHFVACKHEVRPRMEVGDIRLVNNMGVLHRREAFVDDPKATRHLIRVWLHNEELCWKLPTPLRLAWARVFEDHERGESWDIEPPRKDGKLLRVAGSCD